MTSTSSPAACLTRCSTNWPGFFKQGFTTAFRRSVEFDKASRPVFINLPPKGER